MNARSSARSGAALAVVAVRRNLPLESVDTFATITSADAGPGKREPRAVAGSCARFIEGEPEAWLNALPSPAAVARLTDLAAVAAALCMSTPSIPCTSSPRNWGTPSERGGITG